VDLGLRKYQCYKQFMQNSGGILGWIQGKSMTLGFYAYAFFVAPHLARVLKATLSDPQPILWPGLLILLVLCLEPFALRSKIRFIRRRASEERRSPQGSMLGIFSVAVIGHFIVTMFLGMLMLDCWGKIGVETGDSTVWLAWTLILLMCKELAAMMMTAGPSVSREPPGHPQEWVADLTLLVFSCVAYTVWWEALVDLEEIATLGTGTKLVLLPVLGGLFLVVYLAMRLPWLMQEHFLQPARGRKLRLAMEIGMGLVLGLYPLFM